MGEQEPQSKNGTCEYHICKKKAIVYKCPYCEKYFCKSHLEAKDPKILDLLDPNLNRSDSCESGGHPCFPYSRYMEEEKTREEERIRIATVNILAHKPPIIISGDADYAHISIGPKSPEPQFPEETAIVETKRDSAEEFRHILKEEKHLINTEKNILCRRCGRLFRYSINPSGSTHIKCPNCSKEWDFKIKQKSENRNLIWKTLSLCALFGYLGFFTYHSYFNKPTIPEPFSYAFSTIGFWVSIAILAIFVAFSFRK
jgi:phage FluMu protein Com